MTQHTKGPWVLKDFGGPQISGPDGYAVATMWGGLSVSELPQQDLANARLISAAPDLLEALECALEELWHERHSHQDRVSFESDFASEFTAIAKAKGQ